MLYLQFPPWLLGPMSTPSQQKTWRDKRFTQNTIRFINFIVYKWNVPFGLFNTECMLHFYKNLHTMQYLDYIKKFLSIQKMSDQKNYTWLYYYVNSFLFTLYHNAKIIFSFTKHKEMFREKLGHWVKVLSSIVHSAFTLFFRLVSQELDIFI